VTVGIAFLNGLLWAVIDGNIPYAVFFSILLVISHYGEAALVTGVLLMAVPFAVLSGNWSMLFYASGLHVASMLIWFGFMFPHTGMIILSYVGIRFGDRIGGVLPGYAEPKHVARLLEPHNQQNLLRRALKLDKMSRPQDIEWLLSWIMVGLITGGLILGSLTLWPSTLMVLSYGSMTVIAISIVVPKIANFFGTGRTALSVFPLLAVVVGLVLERIGVGGYIFGVCFLFCYGLAVSGLLHRAFGIEKVVHYGY
jgi:hypothetical protein